MDTNNTHILRRAAALLSNGCYGIVGLRKRWGHTGPYVFTQKDELKEVVIEPRYPMAMLVRNIIKAEPDKKFGVIARGCDIRAIKELIEDKLLDAESIDFIGIVCSEEQAAECNCEKPIYELTKCTGCWECVEKCPEDAIEISSCCNDSISMSGGFGSAKVKPSTLPNSARVWRA